MKLLQVWVEVVSGLEVHVGSLEVAGLEEGVAAAQQELLLARQLLVALVRQHLLLLAAALKASSRVALNGCNVRICKNTALMLVAAERLHP